jgi:hypothetical protein
MLLLDIVNALRLWDEHTLRCPQCLVYDTATAWTVGVNPGPCNTGKALLQNLLVVLKKGA